MLYPALEKKKQTNHTEMILFIDLEVHLVVLEHGNKVHQKFMKNKQVLVDLEEVARL